MRVGSRRLPGGCSPSASQTPQPELSERLLHPALPGLQAVERARGGRDTCAVSLVSLCKQPSQLPRIFSHCGSLRSSLIFSTCKRGLGPFIPPFPLYRSVHSLAKWITSNKSLRVSQCFYPGHRCVSTVGYRKAGFITGQSEALRPHFPSSGFPVFTQIHRVLFIVTWNIC